MRCNQKTNNMERIIKTWETNDKTWGFLKNEVTRNDKGFKYRVYSEGKIVLVLNYYGPEEELNEMEYNTTQDWKNDLKQFVL